MHGNHSINMGLKHMATMIACCVIPVAVILAVLAFKVPLGTVGLFLLMLMCPLLHIVMMKGMMGHQHKPADVETKDKMVG